MMESGPTFDVAVLLDALAPMRDGVRLAADVYRPARDGAPLPGAFPTLLLRTPYDKRDPNARRQYGEHWARRGYVSVLQDCRGCYASEGELYFLRQEADDGYDTMVWLQAQPWCNGKVGTHGYSYMAWTQSALANLNPPLLAAMWPSMAGSHAYTSSVRHGGALELRFLCWAYWHAALNSNRALKRDPAVERALNATDLREILGGLPVREGQTVLAQAPPYERWLLDIFTKADYSIYWQHPALGLSEHWDAHADVPVYITGGWYDSYPRAAFENFVGLSSRKRSPVKLLMGPWTHGDLTLEQSYAGDVEFGPEAALPSVAALQQRWFDHCLKGEDTGIDREPPLKLFVMGGGDGHRTPEGRLFHGGAWRSEQAWPLARTRFTGYFLHPLGPHERLLDRVFGETHRRGRLSLMPPGARPDGRRSYVGVAASSYRFDPQDPVPTIGGNVSSLHALRKLPYTDAELRLVPRVLRVEPIVAAGGYDQRERADVFGAKNPGRPLSDRPDVLTYQTDPLEQDLEVTGPVAAHLFVSTDAPDTDFTAKLLDVYPPNPDYPQGYSLNLTDSIFRLRYRDSWSEPALAKPGEIYRLTITLYPTANLFQRGHRIRLDVSSSNFPRFDVNPNTGEPIGKHTHTKVARNTLHHDEHHPSSIVLPVIPRS